MKKTILAILLSLGAVTYGAGETYTITPTQNGTQTSGTVNRHGFTLDLGAAAEFSPSTLPAGEMLSLSTLTFTSASSVADIKLGVFKLPSEYSGATDWAVPAGTTAIQNLGSFVGFSSEGTKDSNGLVTFSFTSLILDPTGYYAFMYVDNDVTEDTFYTEPTGTETNKSAYYVNGVQKAVVTPYTTSSDATNPFTNLTINSATAWYRQSADVTLTAVAIPEPATATLSLLALAGLAARRRRK